MKKNIEKIKGMKGIEQLPHLKKLKIFKDDDGSGSDYNDKILREAKIAMLQHYLMMFVKEKEKYEELATKTQKNADELKKELVEKTKKLNTTLGVIIIFIISSIGLLGTLIKTKISGKAKGKNKIFN
jgi:hypothetical protein